jgi:Putative auto-transporter adhesin, head GIN domain
MKRMFVALAFLFALPVNATFAETRSLNLKDFDEIDVGGGMRVYLTQGQSYRVEATGDTKDLDRLKIKQNRNLLEFSLQSNWLGGTRIGRITLDITVPMLRKLNLSGGTQGDLNQFTVDRFSANISGGSELNANLNSGDLDLNISGGSRVGLSGEGKRLRLEGSGGSGFEAKNLAVTDVRANLSGGSWTIVNMNGELDAQLSGGSHVTYYGNATLGSIAASGGSKVRKGT